MSFPTTAKALVLRMMGLRFMWQRHKAEATEIAGFTADSNNVSESDYSDEYTKEKSMLQNISQKARLPCDRFHGNKKNKTKQRRGNEKRFGFSMFGNNASA